MISTPGQITPNIITRFLPQLAPKRSKNKWGRHIIVTFVKNGRRRELHATKGWRSYRI